MGSKNGKYDIEQAHSLPTIHPTLPRNSSDVKPTKKSQVIPPKCLHHDSLIDPYTTRPENLSLVWLDSNVYHRSSNVDTEIKLKNIIDYIRIFDRVDACERYIKQIGRLNNNPHTRKERLLVIISTTLAPTLIPHLHDLEQVQWIYVFGKAKTIAKGHQEWLKKYPKVKGLFTNSRTLIAQISQDQT